MIFHIIEIVLLLMILSTVGVEIESPTNTWVSIGLCVAFAVCILLEHWFYNSEIDYDKIREIIREELEKEEASQK